MFLTVFVESNWLCLVPIIEEISSKYGITARARWLTTKSSTDTILTFTPKPPPDSQFSPSHLFCFVFSIQRNDACWSPDETEWRHAATAPLGHVGGSGGAWFSVLQLQVWSECKWGTIDTLSVYMRALLLSLSLSLLRSWGYAAILHLSQCALSLSHARWQNGGFIWLQACS